MPVILVLKGQRQEDCFKSEPSLVYVIYIASYKPAGLHGENLFLPSNKTNQKQPKTASREEDNLFCFQRRKTRKAIPEAGMSKLVCRALSRAQ